MHKYTILGILALGVVYHSLTFEVIYYQNMSLEELNAFGVENCQKSKTSSSQKREFYSRYKSLCDVRDIHVCPDGTPTSTKILPYSGKMKKEEWTVQFARENVRNGLQTGQIFVNVCEIKEKPGFKRYLDKLITIYKTIVSQ